MAVYISTVEGAVPIEPPVAKLPSARVVLSVDPLMTIPPRALDEEVPMVIRLLVVSAVRTDVPVAFWIWKAVVELVASWNTDKPPAIRVPAVLVVGVLPDAATLLSTNESVAPAYTVPIYPVEAGDPELAVLYILYPRAPLTPVHVMVL
jgi:hypothetical protein